MDVPPGSRSLNADQLCENSDEGDAEFAYNFSITTSTGDELILATTDDYPSSDSFVLMEDDEGTTGLLNIDGEASGALSEVQSFEVTARITEWDLTPYFFKSALPRNP